MTISADSLRELLAAPSDAQLVMVEGRTAVVTPAEAGEERYRGALSVVSHAELRSRLGDHEPSDELLGEVALRLETAVDTMGG